MMQLDLFAAPKAPAPMTALGAVEILCQGKATPEHMVWGDAGLRLILTRTPDGFTMGGDYSAGSCGGSGPGFKQVFPTREAALIHAARWAIRHCAHDEALADGWPDYARNAKAYLAMVKWLADMLPPMFTGFDALAELDVMRARAVEKETARRAELMRQHKRKEHECAAIRAVQAYGYPNLVQDGNGWLATFGSDDDGTIILTPYRDLSEADAPRLAAMVEKLEAAGYPARIAA